MGSQATSLLEARDGPGAPGMPLTLVASVAAVAPGMSLWGWELGSGHRSAVPCLGSGRPEKSEAEAAQFTKRA